MRIDRLRLVGFKSFADAAELTIAPGLTGIVGPNGCGKSNLVDALRWAMGEASARKLRGGEMDDVIFAGAAGRPARNIAEAALAIDNSERTAPAAFNDRGEIEIVRRIERGGGSAYRLNGREVRARDVQVLLADAGAGGHSGAIVSQGRVGALIDAKPVERRQLLEEAAGVSGLQLRRRETESRLRSAEDNLARLDDVIATLAAQLSGLEKQARRARRYRRLAEQIRQAEALLLHARWCAASAEAEAAAAEHAIAQRAAAEAAEHAAAGHARRAAAEALVPPLRLAESEAAGELQRLSRTREALEQELQRLTASRGEAERRRAELAADFDREEAALAEAVAALDRLSQERRNLEAAAAADIPARRDAEARRRDATARLALAEAELQSATAEEAQSTARRNVLERRRKELAEGTGRLERRWAEGEAQRAALAGGLAAPEAVVAAAAALAEAERRVEAGHVAVEEAERRLGDCRMQEAAAIEAVREVEARLARLQPEAAAIEALLAAPVGEASGQPILAALRVTAGFEAAIGAAFEDELSAPVAAPAAAGAPPRFWVDLPPLDRGASLPEGAHPLAAAVAAPATLCRSLAQAGWVEDAEAGRRLQACLRPGQRLVDREGRMWRWDGFTRFAPGPSIAAQHFRHKNRLALLSSEISDAAKEHRPRCTALAAATADRSRAAEAEGSARSGLRAAEAALTGARAAQSALAQQNLAAETRLSGLADTLDRLAAELTEALDQAAEAAHELQQLPLPQPVRAMLDSARAAAGEMRRLDAEARAAVERLARRAEARGARLAAIAEEERSWRRHADGAGSQRASLAERRRLLDEEAEARRRRLAEIARDSEASGPAVATAAAAHRHAADALARAEAALRRATENARAAEEALGELKLRCARLEALRDGARDAATRLAREIGERVGVEPVALAELAGLAADTPPADPAEAAARLDRLRRERDAIGPVNLVAESEAAEIGARVDELRRERTEMTEAIARLRRGMASLDRDARQRLGAAFERVNRHFADLFARLFGGGRARLALTEDADPLAAGLEIMANPGGKRLQALSLLSGGEQALTALALIFAVFLTSPAPVCVLDEVDAPLDDANVERLCALVAEIAEETGTRFLVVTHHRITMARADRLFGVTMAEPGVSQLVSVDLARAVRLRQSA